LGDGQPRNGCGDGLQPDADPGDGGGGHLRRRGVPGLRRGEVDHRRDAERRRRAVAQITGLAIDMDQKVPSGATGPAAAKAEAAGAATPGKMEVVDGQLGRWAGGMVDAAISAGSLPVIGRLFRPLGAATAMGVWGYRLVPGLAKGVARACTVQAVTSRRRAVRAAAGVYDRALAESLVAPPTGPVGFRPVTRAPLGPMTALLLRRRYVVAAGVSYGPEPEQRLDVWRRDPQPGEPAPVLLYLPGGGWVYGSRRLQAHNMLAHLAE